LKYISERAVWVVFSEKSGIDAGAGQPFPKKRRPCRMRYTGLCGDSLLDRTAVGDVFLER